MKTNELNITFAGGGNMATAFIAGLIENNLDPSRIRVIEKSPERLSALVERYNIHGTWSLEDGVYKADIILIAVKPQDLKSITSELSKFLENQLVLSIVAGVTTDQLSGMLNGYKRIIRVMPNTPVQVNLGVSALYAMSEVPVEQRRMAESIFYSVGKTIWLDDEDKMNAVTALSGSGPAYVFYFMETLYKSAVEFGLSPAQARIVSINTFLGASTLAAESGEDLESLRLKVTSKGGTTEKAIEKMRELDIAPGIHEALEAAKKQSRLLSENIV